MQLAKGRIKFGMFDFGMLVVALWLPASFTQNYDLMTGIEAGGSQTVDMMLAYLIGRASIRTYQDLRSMLLFVFPGLCAAGLLMMLESLSGRLFVREAFQSAFGGAGEVGGELRYERRRGFLRAYGPFSHPIHAGMYLTTYVPLFWFMFRRKKWRVAGLGPGLLSLFSLSSAGFLGLLINAVLIGFDWIQKFVKELGWKMFVIVIGMTMAAIQFFSQGGLIPVIYRYLTFNPRTGWYRTQIWTYATDDVVDNPLWGIGYAGYTRPPWLSANPSIDAHYLSMAVKYGLVPAVIYFLVAVLLIFLLGARASRAATTLQRDTFVGLAICLTVIVVVLFTVAIWGSMLAWFNFLLGVLVSYSRNRSNFTYRVQR